MKKQAGITVLLLVALGSFLGYTAGKQTNTTTINTPTPPITPVTSSKATEEQAVTISTQPDKTVTPVQSKQTPVQMNRIPLIATDGWKTVAFQGISFQIPPHYTTQANETNGSLVIFMDKYPNAPQSVTSISVQPYNGGSRRTEFLAKYPTDCNYIYQDSSFGNVQALQIAGDGGWCQGGSGGIVTAVGSKFTIFHDLSYDLNTKEIYRWSTRDTIISTLK